MTLRRLVQEVVRVVVFALLGWGIFLGSVSYAEEDFSFKHSVGIGAVTIDNAVETVATWHPDLKYKAFTLGLDVNILLVDQRPSSFESVVVRKVGYETEDYGLLYGILDSKTYGYGLLMNEYTTRVQGGNALPTNRMGGGEAYYHQAYNNIRYGIKGMGTLTSVWAFRATEQIHPHVILGQNLVADNDGVVVKDANGVDQQFPASSGYSLDIGFPILPGFTPYLEYAHLNNNNSSGVGAGFNSEYTLQDLAELYFKAEYRSFSSNFVPGFFNAQYETNPASLSQATASGGSTKGYFLGAGATVLAGRASAKVGLESYDGTGGTAFNAEAQAKVNEEVSVAGWYTQPNYTNLRSLSFESGAVYTAATIYRPKSMGGITLTAYYKRYYDSSTAKVTDSTWTEISYSFQ